MSEIILRPYQVDALDSTEEHFKHHQRVLGVCYTGGGKTVMFADLIRRRKHLGRAMVLAHREELIDQAAEKIAWVTGLPVDVEMANRRASQLVKSPVVVSSIQTQIAGKNGNRRMYNFDPMEFATIIADEAHHHVSDNSYEVVIGHYLSNVSSKLLGVTATPKRFDKIALGSSYECCAFKLGIRDGIQEGWLVPLRVKRIQLAGLDLSEVGTVAGDFNQGQLGVVMSQAAKATALAIVEHHNEKKTLVFCASVDQAMEISSYLNGVLGDCSRFVCGETPKDERREIVDGFRKGRYRILVNYSVLLEGFDVWDVACVVCARPTKNALLLEQMIGRGTRPNADEIAGIETAQERREQIANGVKPYTTIIDFAGEIGKHKLASLVDVLGGELPEDVRDLAELKLREGEFSVDNAIDTARRELTPVKPKGKPKYAAIQAFELFGLNHIAGSSPIEQWQKEKLDKWKIPLPDSAEEADDLINEFRSRTRRGLCTFAQAKVLARYGYSPDTTFDDARYIMDSLAQNGWRPIR